MEQHGQAFAGFKGEGRMNERDRAITTGYLQGTSCREIAAQIKRSIGYVKYQARQMGLKHKSVLRAPAVQYVPSPPTLPYVPGIIVTGRYKMMPPNFIVDSSAQFDHFSGQGVDL
jgi:DNA-binding CsgD family transcriptional regulator